MIHGGRCRNAGRNLGSLSSARTGAHLVLSVLGALATGGCFYDFSLDENPGPDSAAYCTPRGYRTALCDRFERTRAFSETLHESFTASPTTRVVEGRGRALEINPPDEQQEWVKAPTQPAGTGVLLAFRLQLLKAPRVDYRILLPIKFVLSGGGEGHVFLRLEPGGKLTLVDEYQDTEGKNHSEVHALPALDGNAHSFRIELDFERSRIDVELDEVERMPADEIFPWLPEMANSTSVAVFVGAGYAPQPSSGTATDAAVAALLDDVLFAVR